jgi:hypothetical protein
MVALHLLSRQRPEELEKTKGHLDKLEHEI